MTNLFTRTIHGRKATFEYRTASGLCRPDAPCVEVHFENGHRHSSLCGGMTRTQALRVMAVMINRLSVGFGISLVGIPETPLSTRNRRDRFGFRDVSSSLNRLDAKARRNLYAERN